MVILNRVILNCLRCDEAGEVSSGTRGPDVAGMSDTDLAAQAW